MTEPVDSSRLVAVLERRPIAAFFTLAVGSSWSVWIPTFLLLPSASSVAMIPGAFGPALAAAVMVRVRDGSIRAWLADGLDWRVDRRWYVAAVGLPTALGLVLAAGVSVLSGTFDTSNVAEVALLYPLSVLALAVVGGGQEEFGWRGYALPALQERWSALTASVTIGVVWAVWHLPAFLFSVPGYTGSFTLYVLLLVGLSIVFTWLYNNTAGSVLLAMLLHGGVNGASGLGALFVGDPSAVRVSPYVILVPLVWVVAVVLLARGGPETLSGRSAVADRDQPAETGSTEVSG